MLSSHALLVASSTLVVGCALGRSAAVLPPPSVGYVAVLSGEMPEPIDQVGRHAWIVAHVPGESSTRRYELYGSGRGDPLEYFGDGEVAIHAVHEYPPLELHAKIECLEREEGAYHHEHPDYWMIPGPNSNTIIDQLLRRCHIRAELPGTAIGRDYRGVVGASVTSLGTGVQLGVYPAGVKLGLEEGVEVQVMDLPFGVHFYPPGITVPINPGRIGIDFSMVKPAKPHAHEEERPTPRRHGVGSAWMFAKLAQVVDPSAAGDLHQRASVAFAARGLYGKGSLGYGFGFDVEAGLGFPLGFAYGATLYPTGVGIPFGRTSFVGLFGGFGTSGVGSHVQGALELPVELRLEVDATERVRVGLRGSVTWIPFSSKRDGDGLLPFGDETLVGTFVRIGRSSPSCACEAHFGRGYFFGLERRELMNTAWLGASFGVEIDASH